jgi:hypothetical protein
MTPAQLIKDYRDRQRRWQAKRNAEFEAFDRASDWIRRNERGWSAISDRELTAPSPNERQCARKTRNKKDQRAREAKPVRPAPVMAPVVITVQGYNDRLARLQGWLALSGHHQRHLRGRVADIMRSWIVYQAHVAPHGSKPSLAEFADAFTVRFDQPMTRPMAQNRLRLLGTLMAEGGPLR